MAHEPLTAQAPAVGTPPSTITHPPRQWGPDAPPNIYPDPDIIVLEPEFGKCIVGNTPIQRLWSGSLWAEGPAWSSQGRYLVWSDVGGDVQYRWLQDDSRVTIFRTPSRSSNGNSFDFQGRQISCEHFSRRVVRWEHDGALTVIADAYKGKRLNSPNDLVPHPDGSIWFTDPPYGNSLYEGQPDEGGPFNPRIGTVDAGGEKQELRPSVYRVDPSGRIDLVTDELARPNGLCFSPDYTKLYVCDTGPGPRDIKVYDVTDANRVTNGKVFTDMRVDGVHCGPDGMRADVAGNLWCASAAGTDGLGYDGVLVFTPAGALIGRIRLPEACANLCFGGPKRNRLCMTASQSVYALYVNTQGATPG
ncbi:MAG: SMP-30/gluconolactonase/LRE family protein [Thermomicrobia bacterium]|nr:SMP-30/gluconolactonase/LRE family protein [Thermomicrobia bacterium]